MFLELTHKSVRWGERTRERGGIEKDGRDKGGAKEGRKKGGKGKGREGQEGRERERKSLSSVVSAHRSASAWWYVFVNSCVDWKDAFITNLTKSANIDTSTSWLNIQQYKFLRKRHWSRIETTWIHFTLSEVEIGYVKLKIPVGQIIGLGVCRTWSVPTPYKCSLQI